MTTNPSKGWAEKLSDSGFIIDACKKCDGLGSEADMLSTAPWKTCDRCNGTGNEKDEFNRLITFIEKEIESAKEETRMEFINAFAEYVPMGSEDADPKVMAKNVTEIWGAKSKDEERERVMRDILKLNKGLRKLISPTEIVDYAKENGINLNDETK